MSLLWNTLSSKFRLKFLLQKKKNNPDLSNSYYLEITTLIGCSVGCSYCPQSSLVKAYKEKVGKPFLFSLSDFKKALKTVPTEIDIVFSGMAEPFLNPNCAQMIKYAADKGHKVRVFTTMTGLKLEDIEVLKKVNLNESPSLMLHVPDADNQMKNLVMNEIYFKKLKVFLESDINIGFECIGEALHPQLEPFLGSDKRVAFRKVHTRSQNVNPGKKKRKRVNKSLTCPRNLRSNILLPSGDVVICPQDYSLEHIIGNLLYQSYDSLYESEEYLLVENTLKDKIQNDILCHFCDLPF